MTGKIKGIPPIICWSVTPNMSSKFCEKTSFHILPKLSQNGNMLSKVYSFENYKIFWPYLLPREPLKIWYLHRIMKKTRVFLPYFTNYIKYFHHFCQTVRHSIKYHLGQILCNSTTHGLSFKIFMLLWVFIIAWWHQAITWTNVDWSSTKSSVLGQFHKRCFNHQSLKSAWKLRIENFIQISQGPMS